MKKLTLAIIILIIYSISAFSQTIYQESFETGFGIWSQLSVPYDDFDWTRHSGSTPSPGTGPNAASDGTFYLYIEATGNCNPGKTAIIESSTFDFSSLNRPIFSFDYHMLGLGIGVLRLYIHDGYNWYEIWNNFESMGDYWHRASVCLYNYANLPNVKFRFSASTFFSDSSDIAIDNIVISNLQITSISKNDVSCGGYGDGSITINVVGGTSPYRYSIDDGVTYTNPVASNTYTFNNLNGADYVVRARDQSGCWVSGGVVTINEPPLPEIDVYVTNVSPCANSHNGSITITVNGLNPPFEYSINGANGPFSTNNVFTNLDTGEYTVAVRNSLGCIAIAGKYNVMAPNRIQILDMQLTHITSCYGNCDGAIKVIAAGGTGQLWYALNSPSNYQIGNYFPSLCSGTYRAYVKDQNNCIEVSGIVTLTQPSPINITDVQKTDVTGCFGDANGTITITASGGTGQLQYSINNGVSFQNSNTFTNLAAGTYKVWVQDSKYCKQYYGEVSINQPTQVAITNVEKTDVLTCYGDNTGSITITATGGTGTLYYSINNGQTFQTSGLFNSLPAGTYYPYVKDQNNCFTTYPSVTITQPNPLMMVNIVKNDVTTCYGGNNGSIYIYVAEGTPPYSYSIDGGNTFQSDLQFNNLTAGTYNVVVKDFQNCTINGGEVVLNQPTQIQITEQVSTNVSCYGLKDGSIRVNAINGTGQLFYSIDNGVNFQYTVGTTVYLGAGTYPIVVRDQNNCTVQGNTLVITQPDSLYISSVEVQNVTGCYGANNGSITINAVGGTPPLLYSINNGLTLQSSNVFNDLPAFAGYIPFVKDANNCYNISNVITITQPPNLVYLTQTKKNVDTCNGVPAGEIRIQAFGGTGTLYYSIDNGQTYYSNNGIFTNLYAGNYHTKVKDDNNCIVDGQDVIIYEPPVMSIDSIIKTDVICNGQSNGTIKIFASGGQPQLMYSIDGGMTFNYSNYFPNKSAATYNIVVRDYFKCYVYGSITITEPPSLNIDTVITTDVNTCYGDATGTITVIAHGGVDPLMYCYTKMGQFTSDYQTSNVFTSITAGAYFVTIKDQNQCTQTSYSFFIYEPPVVKIDRDSSSNIICNGQDNGYIQIWASGGVGNYQYSIDNGTTWTTSSIFNNLTQGTYYLRVKDANNCLNINPRIVNINEPTLLRIYSVQTNNLSCYNYKDGQIRVYATGGIYPYTYFLNDTIISSSGIFSGLDSGVYSIKVIDNNGCLATSSNVRLTMPPPNSFFSMSVAEGCAPLRVKFTPTSAPPNTSFVWDFGDGQIANIYSPYHTYYNTSGNTIQLRIKAIAVNGYCIDSSFAQVTIFSQPTVDFIPDSTFNIFPDSIVVFTNLTPQYSNYIWDFGDGTTSTDIHPEPHHYKQCSDYDVKLIGFNSYGCSDTATRKITVTAYPPIAAFTADKFSGCKPLTVNFIDYSFNTIRRKWLINNTLVSQDSIFSHTFNDYGIYNMSLIAIGYCNLQNTNVFDITVHQSPTANFDVLTDTIALSSGAKFVNYSVNAISYIWLFGDSTFSTLQTPLPHQYPKAGYYDVTLIAISQHGCRDTFTIANAVFVSDEFIFEMPTAFTPDGDGINDYAKPFGNMIRTCKLEIFNRHSQIIFRTDQWDTEFWDGTYNGRKLPIDAYYWKAYIQWSDGSYSEKFGTIILIR